jgi:hypothetical protein
VTIKFDELVELLKNHPLGREVPPKETLYLEFHSPHRRIKDTVTYHSTDDSIVALDINEDGKVLGIEIV